jgi:hypothetical protein
MPLFFIAKKALLKTFHLGSQLRMRNTQRAGHGFNINALHEPWFCSSASVLRHLFTLAAGGASSQATSSEDAVKTRGRKFRG